MPGGRKLTHRAEAAIAALLTEPTLEAAAGKAGVSLATIKNWLRRPAFSAAYAEAKRQLLERTTARLLSACTKAIDTLTANLDCDKPAASNRAAIAILEQAIKAAELRELAEEVSELKRRLTEAGK